MNPKQFHDHFAQMALNVKTAQKDAIRRAGHEVARLFRQNFVEQGFFGEKWQDVKRRELRTVNYRTKGGKTKQKSATRAKGADGKRGILFGRGRNLSRSIKVKIEGNKAIIYSDLPYSAVHNKGLRAGRGKGFIMPKRQFMGDHPRVHEKAKEIINQEINKALKLK